MIPTSYTVVSGEVDDGCSLDGDGGPGMYGPDGFPAPPVTPPPAGHAGTSLRDRVNLLNWNGRGRPAGLFPRRRGET